MYIACIQTGLSITSEISSDAIDGMNGSTFTLEGQILNSFYIFQILETIIIHVLIIGCFSIFVLCQSCLIFSKFCLVGSKIFAVLL